MGKRIRSQRLGRGTQKYRFPSHRANALVKHRLVNNEDVYGKVVDLFTSPEHTAPIAKVLYKDNKENYIFAPEGLMVGEEVGTGKKVPLKNGNTLPLSSITIGMPIYNIESMPGDGGKFIRVAGTSARIVAKEKDRVIIQFPSKAKKDLNENCRATLGIIAGGGRGEKPLVKAGASHHVSRARGRRFPVTSAVAMNVVNHPFGSGRGRHMGRSSTVSRNAPPGQKVGQISASKSGRGK